MNKKLFLSLAFVILQLTVGNAAASNMSKITKFLKTKDDTTLTPEEKTRNQAERNLKIMSLLNNLKPEYINNTDKYDKTLLHYAAENGNAEIMNVLLGRGADCNLKPKNTGDTPLHVAATHECVQILIDAGADVNAEGGWGSVSPLHSEVIQKNFKSVKRLVRHGADVNKKTNFMKTNSPLHCVKSEKAAAFLIRKGADVHAKNRDGETPLHCAVREKNRKIAKTLLKNGGQEDINVQDEHGRTPLHDALPDNTKLLINYGADINICDTLYGTPLHESVLHRNTEKAKKLLECGANKYAICKNTNFVTASTTPLMLAKSKRKDRNNWRRETQSSEEIRDLFRTKPKTDQPEKAQ